MQELMCFSAFLYQYIESIMFLEVARREGAIAPLAPPPKSATELCIIYNHTLLLTKLYVGGKTYAESLSIPELKAI